MTRKLATGICFLLLTTWVGIAHATGNGLSPRERADYLDAVNISNVFLDCVDRAANADQDPARLDDAVACFANILTEDFTITIDGVAGSRPFPDAASFVGFATGPGDVVRVSVSISPGVFLIQGFGRDPETRRRTVDIRSQLTIVQTIVAPNPVFGDVLGGQIVRGRIDFTATEVGFNAWRLTASRFTVMDLAQGLDILSLPVPVP